MHREPSFSRRRLLLGSAAGLASGMLSPRLLAEEPADVPTIDERIRKLADEAPLAMQFKGSTAKECIRWQQQFAAQLRKLLGPHRPPAEWKTVVERRVVLKDHRREELVLVAEGHPPLPVYLLLPLTSAPKRLPGVLAIHGHGKFGYDPVAGRDDLPGVAEEIEQSNYDYGRQLVRRGYAVAVPCLTPFGRRLGDRAAYGQQDPCGITYLRLQLLGKLLIAENLRDCLWAIELLARHERVDAQRLACVGLSYGGRMAMLTAALEPRIRTAVVSGALNVMQERVGVRYSCGAQVIPGLLEYGDVPEIGSLIAPRPCVWEAGSRDSLVRPDWAEQALERMARAYKAFDAADQLRVDRFEGGHQFSGRLGYSLLEETLK
ncbi:MAG TPA: prolyl oligopeptidase family serine peptidase [Pirellulales bacterium]|nr:prolyl oligopeptidase family serine peptidase [Pirellulales bacterium]